jgi:uncharacterized protein DUF2188
MSNSKLLQIKLINLKKRKKMSKKNVHVVPKADGWAVKKEGNSRSSAVTDTKSEAESIGRDLAKNERSELVIHGKDGKIQDKDSYGNDPNPPKDMKH